MQSISRRAFLKQSGSGAAAVGALATFSRLPKFARRNPAVHAKGVASPAGRPHDGPIVVHIPDTRSGQVHLLFGTREVVRHDPALVARIVHGAS